MKHQSIHNRLRRIEGQIRGIEEMVALDRSETDILIQLEAAKSSLSSTIVHLIDSMISENDDGSITISENERKSIMKILRKQ